MTTHGSHPRRKGRRFSWNRPWKAGGREGIALLMVVFIVTVLTALVVSFTDTTQKHLHLTQYYKNRLQAHWTAQSGLQAVAMLLKMDAQRRQGGTQYDGVDSCWNCQSQCYQEFAPAVMGNVLCGSSTIEPALRAGPGLPSLETETPGTRCPVLDENRKLSLHGLIENYGSENEATNEDLFYRLTWLLHYLLTEDDLASPEERMEEGSGFLGAEPGFENRITEDKAETLASYLLDWVDTGNNKGGNRGGMITQDRAEESCPEDGLEYMAKNGMFDSVDEIGLVCGFRHVPHHVIEKLTRHLTIYDVETNINTATLPVLYALCSRAQGQSDEQDPEVIYEALHPSLEDQKVLSVIQQESDYDRILVNETGISDTVVQDLKAVTVFRSDVFRVGIYGAVYDTETGALQANSPLTAVLERTQGQAPGQALRLLYYREE